MESYFTLSVYFAKFCFLSDKNQKKMKKINHLNREAMSNASQFLPSFHSCISFSLL